MVVSLGFLGGNLVMAAPGMTVNKIAIAEEWLEGEANKSTIRLNTDGEWDWLHMKLSGKFLIKPFKDQYSSFDAILMLPELNDGLNFRAGYDWNEKYKICNAGVNYSFQPFEQLAFSLGYQAEERRPELITGVPYRLNNELIALTWELKPWKYSFKLTRNDKEYFEDPQYTSLKYQLSEEISWYPWPNMQFRLVYHESTGDYPAASYKDFWKEEWVIKGGYDTQTNWQYDWEYSNTDWERGFDPYRAGRKVQLKIGKKLNPGAKIIFGATYRDLDYYSAVQDYSEPGVYFRAETDLKSRVESKLGLEFQFSYPHYSWEVGAFLGDIDYDSDLAGDRRDTGIYGIFVWKLRLAELLIKAAPSGDLSSRDAYYQIEIVYKP
jgi:hypothetical protein